MANVTMTDIDALWGPATPQFAYQIAARLEALIADLPPDDPVRKHGQRRLAELDELGHDTSKGDEAHRASAARARTSGSRRGLHSQRSRGSP
jgi:hypothetical protein